MRNILNEITSESVSIPTSAGTIRGHVLEPADAQTVAAAVVLHPATAVPARLYRGFAGVLAGGGVAVGTFA